MITGPRYPSGISKPTAKMTTDRLLTTNDDRPPTEVNPMKDDHENTKEVRELSRFVFTLGFSTVS